MIAITSMILNIYTEEQLRCMNYAYPWTNCISIVKETMGASVSPVLFCLYATGYADMDGRKYVALPMGTNVVDPAIRKRYNLLLSDTHQ